MQNISDKIESILQTAIMWLAVSSANPAKVSLTVKATLVGSIPYLMIVLNLAHVQVGDLTPVIDSITAVVQGLLMVISGVMFVVGFVRKLVRTYDGTHEGLK